MLTTDQLDALRGAMMTAEQVNALRDAILQYERTIGYPELAERLGISVAQCRRMVSARRIKPILSGARTARFHWPSVVAQLQK